MRVNFVRVVTYTAVALLFAAAVRFTPPLPDRNPADLFVTQQGEPAVPEPTWHVHVDTLKWGEQLRRVLMRAGMPGYAADSALRAAASLNPRRIPAGMPVMVRAEHPDSVPFEVALQLAIDRTLFLRREADGWMEVDEVLPWTTDTIVVGGLINHSLYGAVDDAARDELPVRARRQLAEALASIYDYRVDMNRDLRKGDEFRVVAQRSIAPNGAVRIDTVFAASFTLSGKTTEAVRYTVGHVRGRYYDQDGRGMRGAFLASPLEFRRVSSGFGMRRHPILGTMRQHTGLDYAAAPGTPVRAVGDGVVIRAGWGGGYGNVVDIRHPNGFVTRYAHLRGFANGVRAGARVNIEQTIGYVGSTGMSTGPHLHFEVLVNGQHRNPRTAFANTGSDPIPAAELATFRLAHARLIAWMDGTSTGVTKLAMRPGNSLAE